MGTPRVVVVTGANRGIGRAIASAFVAQGDTVATLYRGGDLPDGVHGYVADMRDTPAIDAAFTAIEADLGQVQVLVANAGITRDGLLMRMSDEDFAEVIDVNLKGTFAVVRRASKGMIRARSGRIVLIGSVIGLYGGAGQANYAASKAGLVGLARAVTRELGGRGITANVVAPGFIETDMTAALPEATQARYQASIPAARFGTTDEVARVVTFLASDGAGYISGAVIPVDGGLGMGS
jgi:3-oxoacyl-[acyl-carrier protein] reductase